MPMKTHLSEDFKNQSLKYFWSCMQPALRPSSPACDQRCYEWMEQMLCCWCTLVEGFLCVLCSLKHIVSAPELKVREKGKPCRSINICRNNLPKLGSKCNSTESCSVLGWLRIFKYMTLLGCNIGRGWEINRDLVNSFFLFLHINIQHFTK